VAPVEVGALIAGEEALATKAGLAAVDASLSHPAGKAAGGKAESLGHGVKPEDFLQAQDNGL